MKTRHAVRGLFALPADQGEVTIARMKMCDAISEALPIVRPLSGVLMGLLCSAAALAAQLPAKNVLFIAVDDLNCRIGCYGDPLAKTPNIDRLAKMGVMFRNAYCQYPLCNPSRASLMTGQRPDTLQVHDLQRDFRSTFPDVITLPQLFRKEGYFVARVGKLFHYGVPREIGTDGKDDPISWDYKFNPIGRDKTEESTIHLLTRGGYKNTIGFAMAWLDMDGPDEDQTDAKGVSETIRLLEQNRDKPFFIGMGFFRPHTPWIAPRKYFDLYPPEKIELPARDADAEKTLPDIARNIRPDNYGLSEKDLKDCVRAYYATISFLDAQLGRLLDALDTLGLRERTMVVFWSDHGFLLGEHGQWQKQLLFDPSPRTPLIIYAPGAKGNGSVCDRTVELLGLYPTVAGWAGLDQPSGLEGHDLRPLLDAPVTAPWDHVAYAQVTRMHGKKRVMGYSVHTERYRYTEWDGGKAGAELYDHQNDPGELRNLAGKVDYAEKQVELRKLLQKVRKPGAKVEIRGDLADPQA